MASEDWVNHFYDTFFCHFGTWQPRSTFTLIILKEYSRMLEEIGLERHERESRTSFLGELFMNWNASQ